MHQVFFIPWKMLETIDAKNLIELGPGLGLDGRVLHGTLCAAPVKDDEAVHHALYLTDDLFPPQVESEYRYPGFMTGTKVVFLRQRLEETVFVKQLRYFWDLWVSRPLSCVAYVDKSFLSGSESSLTRARGG